MTTLYLDTNIIIYATEDSKNLFGKDISASSSELLFDVVSCKYHIIVSDWLLEELSGLRKLEQASMLFKMLKPKTRRVSYSQKDIAMAKQQNPDNFKDELHAILAIKSGADYIVTRNINDFKHLKDKIKIVKPEDLF